MIKYLNLFIFALLVGCSSFHSSPNSEFENLKSAAEQGDIRAQSQMGDAYLFGEYDLNVDYKQALNWYQKAADQNDAKSQYNLAIMYLNGYGAKKDVSKSVEYYRKSALQGDADSQLQLGIRYLNGEGVEKNIQTAKEWFQKAKLSGNQKADIYLEK
ncbi:tetratricopeptide repeat protein [Acinetobacter sp. 12966]|uniref:tetratricopeptide repeat protein n=1 Tax=Acinetobacter sp. 12966 TaxID=3058488 RepID=UPI002812FC96|nr:tetratricopeptide repeat protein [Acinetobacter sp. 12966]MDQ9949763.1 tetratricopeptide repeat protein [Acinetobacter sp. 12966]